MMDPRGISTSPRRKAWLICVGAVALLYALAINNQWAIQPDSATYLALGRSLAEGRGLEFNGQPVWSLPPLVPFLVAGCRRLVGPDYWLINLVMKLFAVGTVAMTYPLVRRLGAGLPERIREGVAFGSLLIVGTSARLFTDSTPILTDVPFAFWATLGLYSFVRGRDGHWAWCVAGGLVMTVACATRMVGLVLYGGMVLALAMDFRRPGYARRLVASLTGFALMAMAGVLGYAVVLRSRPAGGLLRSLIALPSEQWNTLVSGTKWAPLGEALIALPRVLLETLVDQGPMGVSLVAAALMAAGWLAAWRRKDWLAAVPALALVLLLVLLGNAAVAPRYLLPLLPVLAYFLLRGTCGAVAWAESRRARAAEASAGDLKNGAARNRAVTVALAIAVGLCVAMSLPKDVREIYWMHQPRFYDVYERGRWRKWVDLCEYLRANGRPGVDVVGTADTSVVHYLSGLPVRIEPFSADGKPHSPHHSLASPSTFPPELFGKLMAESDLHFLVVPLGVTRTPDKPKSQAPGQPTGWSLRATRALEATGAFASPPKRFGDLALYERLGRPSESSGGGRSPLQELSESKAGGGSAAGVPRP